MNKDEMLKDKEQLARIIAFELCPQRYHKELYGEESMCYSDNNFSDCINIKKVVDKIYDEGYRQVADDEMVVKKSEYEELSKDYATINNEAYYCGFSAGVEEATKTTAREILQEVVNAWNTGNLNQRELAYICTRYGIELE